ncbi:amidohydrolase family protein [Weissella paramesenteroides]
MTKVKFINGEIFIAGEFKAADFTVDTESGYFTINDNYSQVVSLSGKFVIPGLINAHTHISDLTANDKKQLTTITNEAELTIYAIKHLHELLSDGVTTIREVGAANNIDIKLAKLIKQHVIEGPNIIASGAALTITGGHGAGVIGKEVDGMDEVRKATRQLIKQGAKNIKLMATGGVTSNDQEVPGNVQFSVSELATAVEEAHNYGIPVAAHAQGNQGIKNAIKAGVDSIEHAIYLDDEAIDMLLETDTPIVPTLSAPDAIHDHKEDIVKWMYDKNEDVLIAHRHSIAKAIKAGVRVVMGTDAGTPFNNFDDGSTKELEKMTSLGLTSGDALLAATSSAAKALRIDDHVGKIAPGFMADFIVLDENPLANIKVLQYPKTVYKFGKLNN